jgi:hypothetical protein
VTKTEIVNYLKKRQDDIKDSLVMYPVDSYEKYLRLCGEYAGVDFALRALFSEESGDNDGEV